MRQPDLLGNPFDFSRLMADLGDPELQFDQLRIAGRSGWQSAAERSTRGERRRILQLPALRRHLLVATPNGRERLRRRRVAKTPSPPRSATERRAWVSDRVQTFGDHGLHATVVEGLAALPDPVLECGVDEAAWLLVGHDSSAWTGSARFVVRDRPEAHRAVVCGPRLTARTVRHEAGHVFHSPLRDTDGHCISIAGTVGLAAYAEESGTTPQATEGTQRHERLAEAFAIAWGPEGL